ncbi:imidazole glycerol phosphate synthase subunit HisF [Thiospirillum jenense]|uniref:imidazole glycerol phosphate synthase subunit HisF n=1 Tax=Thiospirillum jenense TaxID=1653858 RepID=UPI00193134E1|nr:imidazole glycerol phosphate synthase cyclase subunit [Thiospirillum jenense]
MLKKRLIPVLLLKNGLLVRSEAFEIHQIIGNPIHEAKRFNEWNVDELIYLDISKSYEYDLRRDDHKIKGLSDHLAILDEVSKTCFMPLTWGGKIRTISQMQEIISRGADKIVINTVAVEHPQLITQAANVLGSQAVVVSIDVFRQTDGKMLVFINGGSQPTDLKPERWAKEAEERGAGEILLNSINRDGTGTGYDLELINAVSFNTKIPIIACGGVGKYEHYIEGIEAGASAVAAANIWHFKELSDRGSKRVLAKAGIGVRL